MEMLERGWQLAQQLVQMYNIQHFLLESPQNITVTNDFAFRLHQNLWSEASIRYMDLQFFRGGSQAFL